jgi:molybdate transport system substrate-binding protein
MQVAQCHRDSYSGLAQIEEEGEGGCSDIGRIQWRLRSAPAGVQTGDRHRGHDQIRCVTGTGPQTIGAQLARGVPTDVVILSREGLADLIAARRILAGTDIDLARVSVGVAVRAGTPKPDVSTVESFKQVLLAAKTVAVPGSTSGIWLTADLFPRLGIAEQINVKVGPRGTDATNMVATGDADIAVLPVSEIVYAPGVDFAGAIPPEIQFVQTFSAAVVAGSREIESSKRLIEFLASEIRNSGMEPLAASSSSFGAARK